MKPIERQFRQLAFIQVLIGLLAFCIAEGRPVLMGAVGMLAVASWFVTEGPKRSGLNRNLMNLGALGTIALLAFEAMITQGAQPVALVGHFTLALQLVLLFSRKTRREYVQLAVLSPLQMISASVLPGGVTLIYGLLLLVYCFITLLTILSFQLKSAGDLVHQRHRKGAAKGHVPQRPDQVSGPHHRIHYRVTAIGIGLVSGLIALMVFLVGPRAQQDPFAASLVSSNPMYTQNQTGFNTRVRLNDGPIGSGSPEPVLNVEVSEGGYPIHRANTSWLIRGAVQDAYDPSSATWSRPPTSSMQDLSIKLPNNGLRLADSDANTREAAITLRRKSIQNLFTVVTPGGPVAPTYLDAAGLSRVGFNAEDQQLESNDGLASVLRYRVHWQFTPFVDLRPEYHQRLIELDEYQRYSATPHPSWPNGSDPKWLPATLDWPVQTQRVRSYAQQILEPRGLPTDYADATAAQRMDAVQALADHLRRSYRYSLKNPRVDGMDPVIAFLFETREGHCELFASGLAALCRSVGIASRLATGYRASEYNNIGEYYVVRESHAHAWTEADLGPGAGWHVFDATPPGQLDQHHQSHTGWLGTARALYDHLEFNWIATVITYDQNTQQELLGAFGAALDDGPDQWLASISQGLMNSFEHLAMDTVSRALGVVILLALIVAVISLVRLLILRHRRMVALQLTALPRVQRRKLARQLRFYIHMLETLERHGQTRPHWQSPFQFARALAGEAPLCFEPVTPLTELFYEVRFGYRQLDRERLDRIRLHQRRLEQNLAVLAKP